MDTLGDIARNVSSGRPSVRILTMLVYDGDILVGRLTFLGQIVVLKLDGATYWLKDVAAAISWLEITLNDMRIGN